MGIIARQAVKGTIYSYIGVVIGFVTTGILFPRYLETEEIGLLNNLIAYTLIFAQLFSLGFNSVTNKLFPYFRNFESKNHGFSLLITIVLAMGSLLFIGLFPFIKQILIAYNKENAALFNEFVFLLIPLVITYLIFLLFEGYLKALYNATFGIFLRELFQRVLILIATLVLIAGYIKFTDYIYWYVSCFVIPALIIFGFIVYSGQYSLRIKYFNKAVFNDLRKEIYTVSLFGILGGISTMIVMSVDKIMLAHYTGLENTGIYSIAFYFGTLVLIPSRTINRISTTVISEAWKRNDIQEISRVYAKSCLNQFIIGLIIFLGIWVNIDNVFDVITKDFEAGKYVIFFIGLTNLVNMTSGVNAVIIRTSRYYKYQTYFNVLLGALTVLTNLVFIPLYGLNGAALATLLSGIIYNLARVLFVYFKIGMQPFRYRYLVILVIGFLLYMVTRKFFSADNFIIDLSIKSLFLGSSYMATIYLLNLSDDLNSSIDNAIKHIKRLFK